MTALTAPRAFHVMSKPTGAICNLDCEYCSEYCLSCDVRFACNGGCPKDRFISTPGGEPGLHFLCEGYQQFFRHVDTPMRVMAGLLKSGRDATGLRDWYAVRDEKQGPDEACTQSG